MSYPSQRSKDKEAGQGLVEYALILVLVAIVVIAILSLLGPNIGNIFSKVVRVLNTGSSNACVITVTGVVPTLTVPVEILNKTSSSSGGFSWGGTGNDRMKNVLVPSNATIAQFTTKAWRTNVTSAKGNCSPFPNK